MKENDDKFQITNYKVILILFLTACANFSNAQTTFIANGMMALKPMDIFSNSNQLANLWVSEPIPLYYYSKEELANQQMINKEAIEGIVTYSPLDYQSEWTNIDYKEITPYTWKWIELELLQEDGSRTLISLRRPNSWIREYNADKIGNVVYLDWKELATSGSATVIAIYPNQLDTRLWSDDRTGDYVNMPITGKFIHESNNVYDLYMENQEPIGVTANHPIWSLDRNGWIEAGELKVGEQVATYGGHTHLIRKEKREGVHTVYNLEIYRSHNYHVSEATVFVHNKNPPATPLPPSAPLPSTRSSVPPRISGEYLNVNKETQNLIQRLMKEEGVSGAEAVELARSIRGIEKALDGGIGSVPHPKVIKTPASNGNRKLELYNPGRDPNSVRERRRGNRVN